MRNLYAFLLSLLLIPVGVAGSAIIVSILLACTAIISPIVLMGFTIHLGHAMVDVILKHFPNPFNKHPFLIVLFNTLSIPLAAPFAAVGFVGIAACMSVLLVPLGSLVLSEQLASKAIDKIVPGEPFFPFSHGLYLLLRPVMRFLSPDKYPLLKLSTRDLPKVYDSFNKKEMLPVVNKTHSQNGRFFDHPHKNSRNAGSKNSKTTAHTPLRQPPKA